MADIHDTILDFPDGYKTGRIFILICIFRNILYIQNISEKKLVIAVLESRKEFYKRLYK